MFNVPLTLHWLYTVTVFHSFYCKSTILHAVLSELRNTYRSHLRFTHYLESCITTQAGDCLQLGSSGDASRSVSIFLRKILGHLWQFRCGERCDFGLWYKRWSCCSISMHWQTFRVQEKYDHLRLTVRKRSCKQAKWLRTELADTFAAYTVLRHPFSDPRPAFHI